MIKMKNINSESAASTLAIMKYVWVDNNKCTLYSYESAQFAVALNVPVDLYFCFLRSIKTHPEHHTLSVEPESILMHIILTLPLGDTRGDRTEN